MAILMTIGAEAHAALRALHDAPGGWGRLGDGAPETKAVAVEDRRFAVSRRLPGEPVPVLRFDASGAASWTLWLPEDSRPGKPVEVELSGDPADLDADIAVLASLGYRTELASAA